MVYPCRHISDNYLSHRTRKVRLQAVATVCHLLQPVSVATSLGLPSHPHPAPNPVYNDNNTQHPVHATIIYEHVSKVLWLSVTDTECDVRLCALASAGNVNFLYIYLLDVFIF